MEVPLYKLLSQFQRLILLRLRAVSYYYYFFSHKRSRAEEKYLRFAAFYFLNFTWWCHGNFRLCRTYGGMHVNWKHFFIIREVVFEFFSGKRVKNSREALVPSTCKFLFEKGFFSLQYPVKNGHRKRVFSRTLSEVEIFDDGGSWKRWRHGDGYQLMRMLSSKPVPFSIAIAFSFGRAKTIQKMQRVNADFFFLKTEKTISVFKQTRIREDGALVESDTFLR